MTEPQRLKDKYRGGLEGTLLGSARGDAPSARARGRAFVALGVGSAALGVPAATTAAAGAAGAKTVASVGLLAAVKWGGIGLAVGALTVGGIRQAPKIFGGAETRAATVADGKSHPGTDRSGNIAPRIEPDVPLASAVEPAAPEPPVVAPRAAPPSESRASALAEPLHVSPPGSKTALPLDALAESHLAEEVAALDRARRLVATDPERALRQLDEYEQRFPHGDLAPEALVLRIEALVRAGERARAEVLATSYLASHPKSPHAKRIRTILGWGEDAR
jgi:hypothetical protein